mmetsp:Transcript_4274/g.11895  ORF Transcript_4274/g.11895 Transcript_4274/m.11895 type:complete len:84 (+) Transcript_4274:93-344(+)
MMIPLSRSPSSTIYGFRKNETIKTTTTTPLSRSLSLSETTGDFCPLFFLGASLVVFEHTNTYSGARAPRPAEVRRARERKGKG